MALLLPPSVSVSAAAGAKQSILGKNLLRLLSTFFPATETYK